jgi:hypothetical protein
VRPRPVRPMQGPFTSPEEHVTLIRRYGSLNGALLALASLALCACAGQAEVARSSAPAQVAWSNDARSAPAEPEPAADAEEAEEEKADLGGARPGEIDLDAPTAQAEPARPAVTKVAAREVEEEEDEEEEEAAPAPEPPEPAATDPLALELQKRRAAVKARTLAKARSAQKDKKPNAKKKPAAASAEPAAPAADAYGGSDPCRAKSFSLPRVREACASGGRAAAKRVMKDAIGKATATGQSLKCSNCHVDQRDYGLKSNAVDDLKRWLDSSGG